MATIINSKVNAKDLCIVQFEPGQSISATCIGVKTDIFDRIYYDVELIHSVWLDDENAERTIIEGVPAKCISPLTLKCTCDPAKYNDVYAHSRQIVLPMPDWFDDYEFRVKENMSTSVCVDCCIVDNINELWEQAIETTGCFCGHNKMRPWVSVTADDYISMLDLGYEQMKVKVVNGRAMGLYTFYL